MFLRRVVRGQRTYWDLVESVREPGSGSVRQKVLAHLGRDEDLRPKLDSLQRSLAKLTATPLIDLRHIEPQAAPEIGRIWLLDQLWRELGLHDILANATSTRTAEIGFAIVANRIMAPRSKLATQRWLERVARPNGGEWELEYRDLLEAMDAIAERQREIEERVYWRLVDLLRLELTLVFVDLTSVYVEGEGLSPLWQLEMLVELGERYRLQRCVIVGDRGLISSQVIRALAEAGFEYILSLRARQSKTATAALEADADQWQALDDNLFVQEVKVEGEEDRVLLVLNDEKQDIDRRWREQLMEKAWSALDALLERWEAGRLEDEQAAIESATRKLVQLDAHKFFRVRVTKAGALQIEERQDRLAREARLDGVFLLQSSAKEMAATAIVEAYKQLVSVERAFRTLKSFLRVRPVYHFSERRIRAHFLLCVLAYLVENHLARRLAEVGEERSARALLEELESLRVVDYDLGVSMSARLRVLTRPTSAVVSVLAKLGYRLPKQLTLPVAA